MCLDWLLVLKFQALLCMQVNTMPHLSLTKSIIKFLNPNIFLFWKLPKRLTIMWGCCSAINQFRTVEKNYFSYVVPFFHKSHCTAIVCWSTNQQLTTHRRVPWGCGGSSSWTSGWAAWGSALRSEGTWSWWWRRGRHKHEWRSAMQPEPATPSEPADPWG